jgi:hypothetical protein
LPFDRPLDEDEELPDLDEELPDLDLDEELPDLDLDEELPDLDLDEEWRCLSNLRSCPLTVSRLSWPSANIPMYAKVKWMSVADVLTFIFDSRISWGDGRVILSGDGRKDALKKCTMGYGLETVLCFDG